MWIKACTTHQVHLSLSLLSKLKLHLRASLQLLLRAVELMKFGGSETSAFPLQFALFSFLYLPLPYAQPFSLDKCLFHP